jgi:hypothetical protein
MAAINLNTVRATIEGRLATEMAGAPSYTVVFHNMPYAPTPNSSWLQCLVSFGNNSFLTMGGTTGSNNSVIGVMVINIFTPKGVGQGANLTIGKRVRDLYNRSSCQGFALIPRQAQRWWLRRLPKGISKPRSA